MFTQNVLKFKDCKKYQEEIGILRKISRITIDQKKAHF